LLRRRQPDRANRANAWPIVGRQWFGKSSLFQLFIGVICATSTAVFFSRCPWGCALLTWGSGVEAPGVARETFVLTAISICAAWTRTGKSGSLRRTHLAQAVFHGELDSDEALVCIAARRCRLLRGLGFRIGVLITGFEFLGGWRIRRIWPA